ncbi:MAG: hypothetical protein E7207_02995 [Clostridium butyricum]|nr:hypothetical protein [Clostridium butyricum]
MNKKQLIVTSILVLSMLVLAVSQGFFYRNFERISTKDKVVSQFKDYKINIDEYFISLPNEWYVDEKKSDGEYISYELKFRSTDDNITGIIQVINTKDNIEVFANRDVKNQCIKFSDLKTTFIDNGILNEYNTSIKRGNDYSNKCYYIILKDNQIVKVLFNIKNNNLNDSTCAILKQVISSLRYIN